VLQVDIKLINLDTLRPWITQRIITMLGFEDEIVIEFIFNQLSGEVGWACKRRLPALPPAHGVRVQEKELNPKRMQINLTGFLHAKNARLFMGELWGHLVSAQKNKSGISSELLEQKKRELKAQEVRRSCAPPWGTCARLMLHGPLPLSGHQEERERLRQGVAQSLLRSGLIPVHSRALLTCWPVTV
jgi:serine/arginine repetitive matrix protein 1